MQHAENPTSIIVICMEAARVDNAPALDYLTCEVALEKPGIGGTNPKYPDTQQSHRCRTAFRDTWGRRELRR
jgi:hypothetical protein